MADDCPTNKAMNHQTPYERQHQRWRRTSYSVVAIAMILTLWLASSLFGPLVGFIIFTPMLAACVSWLLVNNASAGVQALREEKWGEVNGGYHAFDDLAVAVEYNRGRCQVAARDVFKVMEEKPDAQALRRLELAYGAGGFFQETDGGWWFGEAALLDWLGKRARRMDHRATRFRHWFERDVFPPLHRKNTPPDTAP